MASNESKGASITLRVTEAMGKDVGRAVARLDPKDLARVGASVGDILRITGARATVVKAMPAYSDSRGKAIVQIDGITRGNAKVGLDERVTVHRADHTPATRLTLRPVGGRTALRPGNDARFVGRL